MLMENDTNAHLILTCFGAPSTKMAVWGAGCVLVLVLALFSLMAVDSFKIPEKTSRLGLRALRIVDYYKSFNESVPGVHENYHRHTAVEKTVMKNPLTVVSAYFRVNGKRPHSTYMGYLKHSMTMNAAYHIFYEHEEDRKAITVARGVHLNQTVFTKISFTDVQRLFFEPESKQATRFVKGSTHYSWQLLLVWLAKLELLEHAKISNDFDSEWFQWLDLTANAMRAPPGPPSTPYPDPAKLVGLPKQRLIYSGTNALFAMCFAGTGFMLHRDFVEEFHQFYDAHIEPACINHKEKVCIHRPDGVAHCTDACVDDQSYFVYLKQQRPEYFHPVSCVNARNLPSYTNTSSAKRDENVQYCVHEQHCGWVGVMASLFRNISSQDMAMCRQNLGYC